MATKTTAGRQSRDTGSAKSSVFAPKKPGAKSSTPKKPAAKGTQSKSTSAKNTTVKNTSSNSSSPRSSAAKKTGKTAASQKPVQTTIITQVGTNPNITKTGGTLTEISKTVTGGKKRRPRNVSPKSRRKAALLCTFLGFLSAHRFYLKKPKTALIQLVVLYSGLALMSQYSGAVIFALWPVVDLIMLLTGSFKDYKGRKVSEW